MVLVQLLRGKCKKLKIQIPCLTFIDAILKEVFFLKTGKCKPKIYFFLKSQIIENLLSYGVIFKIKIGDFVPSVKFVNAISIKNIIFWK